MKVAGLYTRIKRAARDTGHRLGMRPSFSTGGGSTRILVFHGLCPVDCFRYNTLFITPETFETQLQLYKKHFNIVSLDDLYNERFNKDRFTICLSFDDGFANNHKYVLPLLEKYKVPAAFFVTGIRDAGYDVLWNDVLSIASLHGPDAFEFRNELFTKDAARKYRSMISKQRLAEILRSADFETKAAMINILGDHRYKADEDHWLQMSAEQIAALSASKWASIGSHSYHHNDLARMDRILLREDLQRSKRYLENITGKEVKALAFPYGSYSPEVIEEAKRAGYTQLLATESLHAGDEKEILLRKRLTINPFISPLNQLYASISGNYR